jgi:hypothetical protein
MAAWCIERTGTPQGGPLSRCWPTCCSTRWTRSWSAGPQLRALRRRLQRLRGQPCAGERVMALLRKAVRSAEADGQRGQECGGGALRAQVPGLRAVGSQGREANALQGQASRWQLQAADQATDTPQRAGAAWSRWWSGCGLSAGLEGVLRAGANAPPSGASWTSGCATGCGPSSSSTGSGTHDLPGTACALGASVDVAAASGRNTRQLVAQQRRGSTAC